MVLLNYFTSPSFILYACSPSYRVMAVTPNVIQRHYSDLLRVFSTSQDTLFVITGGFYQAELIDRDTKNTIFTTTPLLASSRILLDHIEMKVDQSTDNVSSVLEVLEEQVALKEIVQKMKQFLTKVELKQKEVGKQVHINNTTGIYIIIILQPMSSLFIVSVSK